MAVPQRITEKLAKAWAITKINISTDKDTHFTGEIIDNAIERENLTGLVSNVVRITKIAMQAKQNLDFDVFFFSKDTFEDTDLDDDTFLAYTSMDLATYGVQIGGAGQYYLDVSGLEIDYIDDDSLRTLHIGLVNRSGTAKTAGANGEVKLVITYQPGFTG